MRMLLALGWPPSADGATQDRGLDASPREEPAIAPGPEQLAVVGDDLAAQQGHHRPAGYRPPLPRAVVAHVEVLAPERLFDGRVDHAEVGVAARRDDALLRVHAEDLRGIGRGDVGEAAARHAALDHALAVADD